MTVTDVERGVVRNLTTDSSGEYSAPSLIPGTYAVKVSASGFNPVNRQNIAVGVGQEIRIDVGLQTGTQNQTVEVNGAPAHHEHHQRHDLDDTGDQKR